jgi:hypothetical protein
MCAETKNDSPAIGTDEWLEAKALELLNREYGPTKHPADPGRKFTVTFITAPRAVQVRALIEFAWAVQGRAV